VKEKKGDINKEGRYELFPIGTYYDTILKRLLTLYQKALRSDEYLQQSSRIKNQHAKSIAFLNTIKEHAEKEIRKTI
jgi:hypothetical protein